MLVLAESSPAVSVMISSGDLQDLPFSESGTQLQLPEYPYPVLTLNFKTSKKTTVK